MIPSKFLRKLPTLKELLQTLEKTPTTLLNKMENREEEFDMLLEDTMKKCKADPNPNQTKFTKLNGVFESVRRKQLLFQHPVGVLDGCLKEKKYEELDRLFLQLKSQAPVSDVVKSVMIRSYYSRRDYEKVLSMAQEVTKPTFQISRIYLDSCIAKKDLESALSFVLDPKIKWVPKEGRCKIYERLFAASTRFGQHTIVYKLLEQSPEVTVHLFPRLVYYGFEKEARKAMDILLKHDPNVPDNCKVAILHLKVLDGFHHWVPYWKQNRHLNPWIKTLDMMIEDCKTDLETVEEVEQVVPLDPDFAVRLVLTHIKKLY